MPDKIYPHNKGVKKVFGVMTSFWIFLLSSFFWFQSKSSSLRQLIEVLRPADAAQALGHVGRIRLMLDNTDVFDQLL